MASAKRDLRAGEALDGEGGYTVYGRLLPAADSLRAGALPIGLAHGCRLVRPVRRHDLVTWRDVEPLEDEAAIVRREMERLFEPARAGAVPTTQGEHA